MDKNEYTEEELAQEQTFTLAQLLELEANWFNIGYEKAVVDAVGVVEDLKEVK